MFRKNVSLQPFNTFNLDVNARKFLAFSSVEMLRGALAQVNNTPLLILGGGSNVLFTQDYDGIVLKNELKGINIVKENDRQVLVEVQAGENWHQFVLYCIQNNWGGVENLSLIPGTVGAAPMQNIGAYGVEIASVFASLKALEIASGSLKVFDKKTCVFGYRESIFKKDLKGKYVITSVTFRLNKVPRFDISYGAIRDTLKEMGHNTLSLKAISDAVIKIRQSKLPDPAVVGNAGSFFKNPEVDKPDFERLKDQFSDIPGYPVGGNKVKVPAAWLIEQSGWKGKTFGKIGVHKNQPLVLVNYGGGNGKAIRNLALDIQDAISKKFGITLTPEVNIV